MATSGPDFFTKLLGDKLLKGSGTEDTKAVVSAADYVAIYMSAHWCPPCRRFTPAFAEAYQEIEKKGEKKLATIFVSCDKNENAFKEYFGTMPWHAVPFSAKGFVGFDSKAGKLLKCKGIPMLAIFDKEGKLLDSEGTGLVMERGADFWKLLDPSMKEKLAKEDMEKLFAAMDANGDGYVDPAEIKAAFDSLGAPAEITMVEVQTLMTRDADGDGKLSKSEFTVSEYSVNGRSAGWLGSAILSNREAMERKKKAEEEAKKFKAEADGLVGSGVFFNKLLGDKLLFGGKEVETKSVVGDKDFVALYLSAHWCPPCRGFTPELANVYNEIESKGKPKLATIFVSCDRDAGSFKEYFDTMPWHAVPFTSKEHVGFESLAGKYLGCEGIPMLAVFDGTGKLLTKEAVGKVRMHKADFLAKL